VVNTMIDTGAAHEQAAHATWTCTWKRARAKDSPALPRVQPHVQHLHEHLSRVGRAAPDLDSHAAPQLQSCIGVDLPHIL